ncbi:MAG: hypothetical protein ACLFT4_09100 [Bacteroidales bacterium]
MARFIAILILSTFGSCNLTQTKVNSDSEIYVAKRDFGKIDNTILKSELDSVINSLPYYRLENYKTTDFGVSLAYIYLKKALRERNLNPDNFLIYEIKRLDDSIISFHLDHFDYYVYRRNLEKMNKKLKRDSSQKYGYITSPPITGNVSGNEGWYNVDYKNKKLNIIHGQ